MRGRKPKPTTLHILQGTLNATRHAGRASEPRIPPELVDPPEFLDECALAEWHRIAPILHRANLLTALDRAALAAYCTAYSRWALAEQAINRTGLLVKADAELSKNPLLAIAAQARTQMDKYLGDFGLSPVARTRIRADGAAPKSRLDEFRKKANA